MSICGLYHPFFILSRTESPPKFVDHKGSPVLQRRRLQQLCFTSNKPNNLHFIPKAASTSLGGSAGADDYSEQSLGETPKRKRQRIAGIDQDELLDPAVLADPDSCFCEFKGVKIHHKICNAETPEQDLLQDGTSSQFPHQTKKVGLPLILLHGFGASVFSWDRVMKPLAQLTGSKVLAFDRPAFGLTSRDCFQHSSPHSVAAKPLNPYSMIFSVLVTIHFIIFLAAEKAILVGHSAGALVAVQTYFEAPQRVAALVLVGPAVLAPLTSQKVVTEKEYGRENQIQEVYSNSYLHGNPIIRFFSILSKVFRNMVHAIMHIARGMADMLNSLYKKALSAFLRSAMGVMLVRVVIDKFGIPAVRNSWYDSNQITDHVLHGYTKPLRVKGWDKALVEYTAAMLADPVSKPPMAKRLHEISCPVLIVTGDSDRLVPLWNSKRLSQAIPGSFLEVIKKCGHLPQEERPDEFVSVIEKFLQRVFGGLEVQSLQPAA